MEPIVVKQADASCYPSVRMLFDEIVKTGSEKYFHPHPFNDEYAFKLCYQQSKDLYVVVQKGKSCVAWGMLRGWDEGYETPSLGIYVSETVRGAGVGKLMMNYLHVAAKMRGASKIRLKVYADNHTALNLYTTIGYEFNAEKTDGQLLGFFNLNKR